MGDKTVNGAHVEAPGDPSVGIFPAQWRIEGEFVFDDDEHREVARECLKEAFEEILGDPVGVTFDDEWPAEAPCDVERR